MFTSFWATQACTIPGCQVNSMFEVIFYLTQGSVCGSPPMPLHWHQCHRCCCCLEGGDQLPPGPGSTSSSRYWGGVRTGRKRTIVIAIAMSKVARRTAAILAVWRNGLSVRIMWRIGQWCCELCVCVMLEFRIEQAFWHSKNYRVLRLVPAPPNFLNAWDF